MVRSEMVEPEGVMDVASRINKNQQQVNKMQRQRLNQQQILLRRKWSDWSVCSADCLRTRHRTNCDDLIAQNSTVTSDGNKKSTLAAAAAATIGNKSVDSYMKRQEASEGNSTDSIQSRSEDEDELMLKADQVDDDDYADEGDEEDEKDSCDNVDPGKTFESKACSGGLCPPPATASPVDQLPQLGAATITPASPQQANNKETRPASRKNERYWDNNEHRRIHKVNPLEKPSQIVTDSELGAGAQFPLPLLLPGQQLGSRALGKQPPSQSNINRTRLNPTDRSHKNGDNFNSVQTMIAGQPFNELPEQPGGKLNETFGQEPAAGVTVATAAGTKSVGVWSSSSISTSTTRAKNMWPQQLLNSANDALGPQANLIHWTILIGALLTIILLIMLIMRKLFATALPSYHWMLSKQTIKSSSKSRKLGSATAAAAERDSCYSPVPYAFRPKLPPMVANLNGHMVAPGGLAPSSLLTADHHKHSTKQQLQQKRKLEGTSRPPHHMSYAWRAHNQAAGSGVGPTDSSRNGQQQQQQQPQPPLVGNFHRFMVDSNGCHLLGSSGSKFNTDQLQKQQQQEVYTEPFSQVLNSTRSSQRCRQMQGQNYDPDAHSILSANYNTLDSGGHFGNSAAIHINEACMHDDRYDKGFVLSRDFMQSATSANLEGRMGGSYHRSMTRKPKAAKRRSRRSRRTRRRSSSETSSHEEDVACEQEVAAAVAAASGELVGLNEPFEPPNNNDRITRSASISSSTDESPSVQSTTAQLLSHAASSSFEQPSEFEGSMQMVSNPATIMGFDSGPAQASPASLGGGGAKMRHNKLTCLVAAQSQPNSPMFVNQFSSNRNYTAANHKLVHKQAQSSSSSRSTRLAMARLADNAKNDDSEYAQPEEPQVVVVVNMSEASSSSNNDDNPQKSNGILMASRLEANLSTKDCDSSDGRHFYEEIQSQYKPMDNN